MKTKLLLPLLACLGVQSVQSAVTYVGMENGFGNTFTAQRWSSTSEPKTFDTNGERYGTSGYYYLAPRDNAAADMLTPVTGNDINQQGTLLSKPAGLPSNPSVIDGNWVNFAGYSLLTSPANDSVDRIGGISAGLALVGGDYGFYNNFATLSLSAGQSYRFGIMVDALGNGFFGPDAVSIFDSSTATTTYSTQLTQDAVPELVFFDIVNTTAGTVAYEVALHNNVEGGTSGFSLLTFDPVPEPSTYALLGLSATAFLVARLRRRRA